MRDLNEFGNRGNTTGGTKRHRSHDGTRKKKLIAAPKYNFI
jgi:hypothetical protein